MKTVIRKYNTKTDMCGLDLHECSEGVIAFEMRELSHRGQTVLLCRDTNDALAIIKFLLEYVEKEK